MTRRSSGDSLSDSTEDTILMVTTYSGCPPNSTIVNGANSSHVSCWYGHRVSSANPGSYQASTGNLNCAKFPIETSTHSTVRYCPNGMPVADDGNVVPSVCLNPPYDGTYIFTEGETQGSAKAFSAQCNPKNGTEVNILPETLSAQDIIKSVSSNTGCCDIKTAFRSYNVNSQSCCERARDCSANRI